MSTQKWESVTWDWLEQEIVDYLVIPGRRPKKSGSLLHLLTGQPNSAASSPTSARKQAQERNNG
jgi:hypothetical protein